MKKLVLILGIALAISCNNTEKVMPEVVSSSTTSDYYSATITAEFSNAERIDECGITLFKDGEQISKIPAELNGDSFSLELNDLRTNTNYTYSVYYGNGTEERSSELFEFQTLKLPYDETLWEYMLSQYDTDGDKEFSEEEISAVTDVVVSDLTLQSLSGLEVFTSIEKFACGGNGFKILDLSQLKSIVELSCGRDDYEKIIFDNPKLESIYLIYAPKLKSFSTKGLPSLKGLAPHWLDALEEVDLSGSPSLEGFGFYGTSIKSIDLSDFSYWHEVDCRYNEHLDTLYLKKGVKIDNLLKDDNTTVVYK